MIVLFPKRYCRTNMERDKYSVLSLLTYFFQSFVSFVFQVFAFGVFGTFSFSTFSFSTFSSQKDNSHSLFWRNFFHMYVCVLMHFRFLKFILQCM